MKKFIITTVATLALTLSAVSLTACGDHEHTLVKHDEVKATCTEAGNKLYWECSDCEKIYLDEDAENEATLESVTLAATGHTEVVLPAVPATCTDKGLTEGKKCSVCDETLVAQEEIDVDHEAHVEEVLPAVPATCTDKGLTAGKKCSLCDEILVEQEETAVDPEAHNYEIGFDENGHWYVCSYCEDETDSEAHKGGRATAAAKAKCEVCGEEYGNLAEKPTYDGTEKKFGASLAANEGCDYQEQGNGYDGHIFGGMTSEGVITYVIESTVSETVDLRVAVAGGTAAGDWGWNATQENALEVFVNGESLGMFNVGPAGWVDFNEIHVAYLEITEGVYTIEIHAGEEINGNLNFSHIKLAPVLMYSGSEMTIGAGNAVTKAGGCNVQPNGDGQDGNIIGGVGEGCIFSFSVFAEEETEVTLYASAAGGIRDDFWSIVGEAEDAYEIFVNGVSVGKISVGTGDWTNFTEILIGTVTLQEGENTIEFRVSVGNTNFNYIRIAPEAED